MSDEGEGQFPKGAGKGGHRRWSSLPADLAAVALLALLPLLFFWRLLTPYLADRAHLAWGDFGAQYYPLRLFVARELAQGRLPLWNPYLNGGQPALADAQSAVFYPPNLILALSSPHGELTIDALEHYLVAHFILAAIFTYLFARYLLRGYGGAVARLAALLAAGTFAFGGYLTSFPMQQLTILEASVWLPLVLLLVDLAAERRSWALFALAGLPLAMSWLAGHAQTTMYVIYVTLAYSVVKMLFGWHGWSGLKLLGGGVLAVGMGSALAAGQLLPTYEFLRLSTRVDLSYHDTSYGMPLPELIGLLLPDVFGGRTLYVGVLGLTLAALAIVAGGRRPAPRVWLGIALAALLVSFGGNTFLYSFLYLLAPGFSAVRNQERAVFLVSFAVSLLAGYGLATFLSSARGELARPLQQMRRLLLWGSVAIFALVVASTYVRPGAPPQAGASLGLVGERGIFLALLLLLAAGLLRLRQQGRGSPGLLASLALPLLLFDLFTVNWQTGIVDAKDAQVYAPTKVTEALAALPLDDGPWRVSSEGLLPGGGSGASVYRWRDVVGNTPFQLKTYAQANAGMDEVQRTRLLAVGYWLTRRQFSGDGRFRPLAALGDLRVYELGPELRLPRAYVVHQALIVPEDTALAQLGKTDFAQVAVLSEPLDLPLKAASAAEGPPQFLAETPTRQLLSVDLSAPGLLVLSEMDYPGWRAFVEGEEVPVRRVQYLLRGIALPAGRHEVEMRFEPFSLREGITISAVAAGLLAVLLCGAAARHLWRAGQPVPGAP